MLVFIAYLDHDSMELNFWYFLTMYQKTSFFGWKEIKYCLMAITMSEFAWICHQARIFKDIFEFHSKCKVDLSNKSFKYKASLWSKNRFEVRLLYCIPTSVGQPTATIYCVWICACIFNAKYALVFDFLVLMVWK